MLQLADQAAAILSRLGTIAGLNQVDYLDGLEEAGLRPIVLPAAQLVLIESVLGSSGSSLATVQTKWMVLVKAKSLVGPSGSLAIADTVLNALSGLQPVAGAAPLLPDRIKFYDNVNEMAGYAVTLTTTHRAALHWAPGV